MPNTDKDSDYLKKELQSALEQKEGNKDELIGYAALAGRLKSLLDFAIKSLQEKGE